MSLEGLIGEVKSSSIVRDLQESVLVTDRFGIIKYFSPQFLELVGANDKTDFIGKHIFRDFPFEATDQKTALLELALESGEPKVSSRVRYGDEGGEEKYVRIQITPRCDNYAAVVTLMDTTQEVLDSTIDALTGAYSQTHYIRVLRERSKYRATRTENKYLGIVAVDIKGLKTLNDERTHQLGDKLLKATVQVLMASIRGEDYVIRDGGDEFLLICPGADESKISTIKRRIRARIGIYNKEISDPLQRMRLYITGEAGNSNYDSLFEAVYSSLNAQKGSSR